MAAKNLHEAFQQYPELRLAYANTTSCVYHSGKNRVIVPTAEAKLYVRTYEYCKSLIKLDRYDAAKSIAFGRNEYNQLPFDRLPFLALLTDPGHLVETVRMQPKLEIVPEVKGKRVSFFYEEGQRHQQVNGLFVGRHLRVNSLCEDDVEHQKYEKAILRAISAPLSSKLIATYDAHIQCNQLLKSFDLSHANAMNREYGLKRDLHQEYRDFVMPLAQEFRNLYRQTSKTAAYTFAHQKGFVPVIENNKLVTLKKAEAGARPNASAQSAETRAFGSSVANVPTLHYAISEGAISRQTYHQLSH